MQRLIERSTLTLVALFIVLDLIAGACYLLYNDGVLTSRFFRLGRDRGLFELIEYGKMALIVYVFWAKFKQSQSSTARAWAILFAVMLLDNAAGLHEAGGKLFAAYLPLDGLGLERGCDVGELIMLTLLEGAAMLYVVWTCWRAGFADQKKSIGLVVLVGLLGAVSVTSDLLHMSSLEEPAEILGMTILLAYVHHVFWRS